MERISLANSAFEGNNNAYLFADGPEVVLIDCGDRTETTRKQLAAEMANHGVTFADVDRIFLTHWHGDHSGLSGPIQRQSGADVYIHSEDAPLVAQHEGAWDDYRAKLQQCYDLWGMPEEKQAVLRSRMSARGSAIYPPTVTPLEDGETFSFNGHELEVTHVSGHAAGLCTFTLPQLNGRPELFSGDALLPKYTPNVGGADVRVDRPLDRYLDALAGIVDAEYARAWPGHREPIDNPTARAKYIIRHHEERAWKVLNTLRQHGPCDTWTVSAKLFGDLSSIHILHGPGEAHAHLEHLERTGAVVREGTQYSVRSDVIEALRTSTENRWPLESATDLAVDAVDHQ